MPCLTIKGTSLLYNDIPFDGTFNVPLDGEEKNFPMICHVDGMIYPDGKEGGRFQFIDAKKEKVFFTLHVLPHDMLILVGYDRNDNYPFIIDYDHFSSKNKKKEIDEENVLHYLNAEKPADDNNVTFLKNFVERDEYIPKNDSEDPFLFRIKHTAGKITISLYPSKEYDEYPYTMTIPTYYDYCCEIGFYFSEKNRTESYLLISPLGIDWKDLTPEDVFQQESYYKAVDELF